MKILENTKGQRVFESGSDRDSCYMGMVVLSDVKLDDAAMQEEVSDESIT